MVWFQCDDCDDNLKKPALPNHFRRCRASGFSCIDCGAKFDRQSVQQHTQCVTEAEKYGPKGTAAATKNKKNGDGGQVPEEIVNMGLSTKPPWSCRLCNVKATGREVLLIHGQSKRHGSKARAAIAASKPAAVVEKSQPVEQGFKATPEVIDQPAKKIEEGDSGKKRKRERKEKESIPKDENGEIVQKDLSRDLEPVEESKATPKVMDQPAKKIEEIDLGKKKRKKERKEKENISKDLDERNISSKNDKIVDKDLSKIVGWRKLIAREIKKSDDGVLKKRTLEKAVIPAAIQALKAAGMEALDTSALKPLLENYLATSKKFSIQGKRVRKIGAME